MFLVTFLVYLTAYYDIIFAVINYKKRAENQWI